MAVAPYPHIKMGVRDESIATILEEEVMPLDKPLYMIRAKKGPIGVPIWCPTYTRATQVFGVDTFNPRSKYYSEASYFLLKTMTMNGAFLMRVASDDVKPSKVFLEVGVKKNADIPLWTRNSITGAFNLADDGSRIKGHIDESTGEVRECRELEVERTTYAATKDASFYLGTPYFFRDYATHKYTPFKGTVAESNMVVWYGEAVSEDPEADLESHDTLTAEQVTQEMLANDFVFRDDREAGDTHAKLTYIDSMDDVTSGKYYWANLKYKKYLKRIVAQGDDLEEAGRYYISDVVYADGFEYKQLVLGESSRDESADVVVGDKIWSNGDITRAKLVDYFDMISDTDREVGPDPDKQYYLFEVTEEHPEGRYVYADGTGHPVEFETGVDYFTKRQESEDVFIGNFGTIYVVDKILEKGELEEQSVLQGGIKLFWRARQRNDIEVTEIGDQVAISEEDGIFWYPVMSFITSNPGKWGEDYGFRFFYDRTQNTLAATVGNGAVTYSFAPVEWKEGDTTPASITNAYGETTVTGTAKLNVYDATTGLDISLKKLVPANYSGSRELPVQMYWAPGWFSTVGKMVMDAELNAKDSISSLYPSLCEDKYDPITGAVIGKEEYVTFVEDIMQALGVVSLNDIEEPGYMANIVSAVSSSKIPYFASEVCGSYDEATDKMSDIDGIQDMNGEAAFRLGGGVDGPIDDWDIEKYQRYQIDACIAGTQEYLIDYLRCPYNNIIDTGVSIATKKSYLDFMGVRDNLTVFLTPQQIWKTKDDFGNVVYPAELSRYEDESVGAMLRSYGLLMREDIENATEANRAIIFLASGINSDHDWNPGNLVASTLWVALKNAQYLSGQRITAEPIERPNSEITCYDKGMTWTAASEETRSRCWNAGLNYAQYFDQDGIHYASCRSIYKYDTSVLCDMGTVRAVTFAKDIIRKEWAIWAGSKRKADDLNARITKALSNKLATMLNQKYDFTVNVYQTDEDKQYGYVRHVDLTITSPATNRVWLATIIVRREGFDPNAEAAA